MSSKTAKPFHLRVVDFLSSFALASVILVLLLVITFLGTLEQAEYGLVASQQRYFESFFVDRIDIGACWRALALNAYKDIGNVSLPLIGFPGGYLLMAMLFVNLLIGGILRVRVSQRNIGVIISHGAILFMIAAGAVTHHFATEGNLTLREGDTGAEFSSFHDRVIEIEKAPADPKAKRSALLIDESLYSDLDKSKTRTFTNASLPFDLIISHWVKHGEPRVDTEDRSDAVGGHFIQELSTKDAAGAAQADEHLSSACIAIARDKKTGAEQKSILWEFNAAPWTVTIGDEKFLVSLTRRTYPLPFAIRLEKTEEEKHPGTIMARRFTSWVTKISDGHEEKRVITMNEPVRGQGFAVFQSTFDAGRGAGGVKRSGFMIVENPADHWPLIACLIVGQGLMLHFFLMLGRFLKVNPLIFGISFMLALNAAFGLAVWKLW